MSMVANIPAPAPIAATMTIMIVEDTAFWQKRIEQALTAAGYSTILASDGAQALVLLEKHNPDLVISDIEMIPMSGLELMKELRSKPQWQKLPIILLTTSAAKDQVIEATRLRATEYMLKAAFSADKLVERVQKCIKKSQAVDSPSVQQYAAPTRLTRKAVASAFPRLLERGQVLAGIAAHVIKGKTLTAVVAQATEACQISEDNPGSLLEIIKHDPIFAMRVLHQSNASKRVGTVEEAIRVVGVKGILSIAQSLSTYPATSQSPLAIWQHSIAVARVMHKIVPRSFEMKVGVTHLIGLLHDLPEILLRQAFPAQYEAASDFADQARRPVRYIMPDVFGVSMSDVANDVVSLLKLPPLIATPLREYAAATGVIGHEDGSAAPPVDRLAMALQFAEYYVNALRLTSAPSDALIAPVSLAECRAAYVATDAINGADIRSQAISISKKMAGDSSDTPAATTVPHKVWYVRHKSYAALDPVEEALKMFADVELHPEPPSKREDFTNLNGVVISSPTIDTFGLLWCTAHFMPKGSVNSSPKVLFVLPSSAAKDPKRPANDDVKTLYYPFSLTALEESLKFFQGDR